VLGPEGLSRFEELSRREGARTAILYAFDDLLEHDGEDMRNRPFLDRQAAWLDYCAILRLASYSMNTLPRTALSSSHACRLGAEGIVSKKVDGTYRSGPCRVWIKVRNPAGIAVQRERSEIWNRRASDSERGR
jgi:bifunctional non-homologous end joining protein LigD